MKSKTVRKALTWVLMLMLLCQNVIPAYADTVTGNPEKNQASGEMLSDNTSDIQKASPSDAEEEEDGQIKEDFVEEKASDEPVENDVTDEEEIPEEDTAKKTSEKKLLGNLKGTNNASSKAVMDKQAEWYKDKSNLYNIKTDIAVIHVGEEPATTAAETWFAASDESIECAVVNEEGDNVLYIYATDDGNPTIYANQNSDHMFAELSGLRELTFDNFDTSDVTVMSYMFFGCSNLTEIDLSSFDTGEVTDMWWMFSGCSSLTALDLSNFNTNNVTKMYGMFNGCSSLAELDLGTFNTNSATDMRDMFLDCGSLTALDLSSFNTGNVTSMIRMFSGCSSLTELDLSNFNTDKVTSMQEMFNKCSSLSNLNISNFNTSMVTGQYCMYMLFSGCSSLTELDLSSFDTSSATDMGSMFRDCSSLTELDLSGFNTDNVTDMRGMFDGCSGLSELDLSNFNTSSVTDMSSMFRDCSNLTELDISSFNTGSVTDMMHMFNGCSSLNELNISSFNTGNVTDMRYMFRDCANLVTIISDDFNIGETTQTTFMFDDCSKLTGEKGTTYNVAHRDGEYARIDGGPSSSTPGYFSSAASGAKTFKIIWKNYDGTVLETKQCEAGKTPSYTGRTPVRPDDAQYSYTFAGWSPQIAPAAGDAVYTAQYNRIEYATVSISESITDSWEKNSFSDRLSSDKLGVTEYAILQEVLSDAQNPQAKIGISVELTAAQMRDNALVSFTYDIHPVVISGGSDTDTIKFNKGKELTLKIPVPDCITTEYVKIRHTNNGELIGNYHVKVKGKSGNKYAEISISHFSDFEVRGTDKRLVRWVDYDGTELKAAELEPGAAPVYTGSTPQRQSDGKYNYSFSSWSNPVEQSDGSLLIRAQYKAEEIRTDNRNTGNTGRSSGSSSGSAAKSMRTGETYSKNWFVDASGAWRIKNSKGVVVTNAWLCDDAVTANGQNVWYLLKDDGSMMTAGLVQDKTGNFYSLETAHNGYFGMMRYKDGYYECNGQQIYLKFSQRHDGSFGAIINADGIEKLKAIYGVTQYGIGNESCTYTASF